MAANKVKTVCDKATDFFGSKADEWVTLYEKKAQFRDRLALFVGGIGRHVPRAGRVLDFGCGPGIMSMALAAEGYRVTGVDGSERMIEVARRQCLRGRVSGVDFQVMDSDTLSLERESYDGVVCSSVLEYVEDDDRLLSDLARVLRPGGVLLISVPHAASLVGKMEDAMARVPRLRWGPGRMDLRYSRRRYRTDEFLSRLRDVSLETRETTYFELPLLGQYGMGTRLSRFRRLGVMLLVTAVKKRRGASADSSRLDRCTGRKPLCRYPTRKALWEKSPPLIRASLGRLFAVLPLSLTLGRRFVESARWARLAQNWSAEEQSAYCLSQLRGICRIVYEKTEYYRRAFDDAGVHPDSLRALDSIVNLPTVDRSTVSEHGRQMLSVPPDHCLVDYCSTGATSATPLSFYINADRSPIEYGYLVVSWERAGYRLGMPMAVLRGRIVPPDRQGLRHEYDPILRHHYYSAFHLSDENMARYLEHMATVGPCFLHVYPSSVAALARFCQRAGVRPPGNIRGIIAESEIVYPEQRKKVEEVFGCRYFSCYGHSEKLVLAAECEYSTDYHVWSTYGYFELLDEAGSPVTTPGQRGEIVGTGFINTVMPFIRYRTGDYATYVGDRCEACGREHPIIRDIRGHRTQEVLIASDGSEIPWVALNMHDDTFLHVRQFQFLQEAPGVAVLRVVPADGFSKKDAERIRRNLGYKLDGQLSFTVELVNAIPLSPRGKAIYVDQRIPNEKRVHLDPAGDA